MNVRCTILTNNGEIVTINKDASYSVFLYGSGLYVIDSSVVSRIERQDGILEDECELLFLEGDPLPIGSTMPSGQALYDVVLNKIVDATAEPDESLLGNIIGFFRKTLGV